MTAPTAELAAIIADAVAAATARAAIPKLALSAAELGSALGISERGVYRLRDSGALPEPVSLGAGRLVWPVAEIGAWLASGAPDRAEWESQKRMGKSA